MGDEDVLVETLSVLLIISITFLDRASAADARSKTENSCLERTLGRENWQTDS
jgi:hypothetical protein